MLTRYRRTTPTAPAFTRDPFFRLVDRFFDDMTAPSHFTWTGAQNGGAKGWLPAVDVVENDGAFVVTADLPGLDKEAIDISLDDGVLTLAGERKLEEATEGEGFRRFERSHGSFSRSFSLPQGVDVENVSAEFANGVLTLTLPKVEVAKARKIAIA